MMTDVSNLQFFDTYEEAAIKEKEIFILATTSESENIEILKEQTKKRKNIEKNIFGDNSCRYCTHNILTL